ALTRADLVEVIGAQLPLMADTPGVAAAEGGAMMPRQVIEECVDAVAMRLTGPRLAHQREGTERFTVDLILAEERRVFDMVDETSLRNACWVREFDTPEALGLSVQQHAAVTAIAASPQLVQPLSAPAGAGKTTSMRALRALVERQRRGTVIVIAPTGKAVDVAVAEGAASEGFTMHAALARLADGRLRLDPFDVVVVDEAGMVGTHHWRALLTHTTTAGVKTVMVGDPRQLAPVKARGGMFTQLCEELPWAQRLTEVWRMHDPGERSASLALGQGGPAPVRRAVGWYRDHDRLHCGDQVTMAADALEAHQGDVAAGRDALLIADTTETTDALNRRIHDQITEQRTRTGRDTTTVTAARGHQVGVGDVILTRLNDATVEVYDRVGKETRRLPEAPVRNGQRWQVLKVDDSVEHPRIAARRLGDGAVAVLEGDYLKSQVQLGHAVTVHSAQGVTADSCRAVVADTTTRNLAYVAMTRGRDTNEVYLYERTIGEADHQHRDEQAAEGVHVAQRGGPAQAARMLRQIVGRDEPARTAHQTAADTSAEQLPELVANLVAEHHAALTRRHTNYQKTQRAQRNRVLDRSLGLHRGRGRSRERDQGYDLSL
ncbi:MAG: AAA family ATPase, partial [Gordonia sp. (in: high G+C Gram-positive bacteria)]|uniref:ATP-dependent DNA helicase n=1 Tax=Gordonia sp. (in: high G+C Gram-positive bacteria) TaxID=84139 RepID=UPI003BB5287C